MLSNFNRWIFLVGALILLAACNQSETDMMREGAAGQAETAAQATSTLPPPEVVVTRTAGETLSAPDSIEMPAEPLEVVELDVGLPAGGLTTLDPQRANTANGINLIENLFAGLTRYNWQSGEIEGELAESWRVSADGLTWTFELRTDVFWVEPVPDRSIAILQQDPTTIGIREVQRGRQVVADDIVYAVQRACDPATETPDAFILFIITGCEQVHRQIDLNPSDLNQIGVQALGPFTLEFSLTRPAGHFLSLTTLPLLRPIPREVVAETLGSGDWAAPDALRLMSGPFLLSPRSNMEEHIVLQRNPFWPLEFSGNVETVNLYLFEDSGDAYGRWTERALDIAPLPAVEREDVLARTPQKVNIVSDQAVFYLAYNFDSSIFKQAELRRAFGAAIDRERLIEDVYTEQGLPMRHFSPPGVVGAPPIGEIGIGFDPSYARQQLAAAGVSSCRFLPEIRFVVSAADTSLFQAELIREMWVEYLGCTEEQIIIEQMQFGTLLANTRRDAGNVRPDVWELGWASYYPDAHNWLSDVLHCTESDNRMNRPCGTVDDLIRRAETADQALREQIYRRVEYEFFEGDGIAPITPLFVRGRYFLVQTWVERFVPASFGGEQYELYRLDWELKQIERQQ